MTFIKKKCYKCPNVLAGKISIRISPMLKGILKFIGRLILFLGVLALLVLLMPRAITSVYALNRVYQKENAPTERLAIVFGAGLRRDGTPTPILRDRVQTAADLYFSGKVEKILMSGDNRFEYYNEPGAMRQYALSLGVPDAAITLDYAGRRTYDTCFRAKAIFGAREALLVTQKFHLPRALFLCNALGLKSYGIEANNNRYRKLSLLIWNLREQIATVGAFIDVYLSKPVPVLGTPEPLFGD
jgi:SanA protein